MDNLPNPNVPQVIIAAPPRSKIPFIIAGIIILLAIILGLKYFNLISFPKMPNFLNSKISQPKTTVKSTPAPAPAPKVTLSCPVPKEFCSKAKEIPSKSFYLGSGFKLPANTPILAPFDGKYQMIWEENKQASYSATLKVTENSGKYSAIYLFAMDKIPQINGKQIQMRQEYPIKKGEQLAASSGKAVPYRFQEGNSLVFYIYKTDKDLPETRIPLKPEDLSQNISLDSL